MSTLEIWTSRTGYTGTDRLDITVKGQDSFGRYFAPTWLMVKSVKNGTWSEQDYEKEYRDMMLLSYINNPEIWRQLFDMTRVTLVCFCAPGSFCHRYILRNFLAEIAHVRNDFDVVLKGEHHF